MTADVFDKQNNKVDTAELPDKIFNAKWNPGLVHQAILTQLANQRQTLAHAKGRGEVRGGGRKPWRQKGTGRSRHGSRRSPIWIGGGATHGPTKERKFAKKLNKKMNRLAIFSILSKKNKDQEIKVIDSLKPESLKTKSMTIVLKNILAPKSKTLLIASSNNKQINRAASNIKNIGAISSKSLNVYDLMKFKNIVLEKEAIEEIQKYYK